MNQGDRIEPIEGAGFRIDRPELVERE